MKAGVVYGKNDIRYEESATPVAEPGTVRIRLKACGICGSDVPRVLEGAIHGAPIILGHEFSGVVDQVGAGVVSFEVGDHVVGVPLVPCFECDDCRAGNFSLCKHYSFIGSRQHGGMAEYVVVPEQNALKIDQSIPFEAAALFEPSSVALHGILLAGYRGGGTVCVLGGGTIGILTLQWLRVMGAERIVVVGRDRARLEISKEFGADELLSVLDEDYEQKLQEITKGKGFDYVFETAGSAATIKLAFTIAANRATVCFIGTPTSEVVFSHKEWELLNRKEMAITGSWMSYSAPFPGTEWERTAQEFASGGLRFDDRMLHASYPLEHITQAFEEFKIPGKVKGKILITL